MCQVLIKAFLSYFIWFHCSCMSYVETKNFVKRKYCWNQCFQVRADTKKYMRSWEKSKVCSLVEKMDTVGLIFQTEARVTAKEQQTSSSASCHLLEGSSLHESWKMHQSPLWRKHNTEGSRKRERESLMGVGRRGGGAQKSWTLRFPSCAPPLA